MWRIYFNFKGIPGVIINQTYGRIDFRSQDLNIQMLMDLWENDFPYLEITEEGRKKLYGVAPAKESENQEENLFSGTIPKKRSVRKKKALQ